jgi:hypothetical protein
MKGGVMKTYSVFYNDKLGYEFVKQGWSWPAFCFSWLWALIKQLWALGISVFIFSILLALIFSTEFPIFSGLVGLTIGFVFGRSGNHWWCDDLLKKSYRNITTVQAQDEIYARQVYRKWNEDQKQKKQNVIGSNNTEEKIISDMNMFTILEKLGDLKSRGILTEEEFQQQKKIILDQNR